MLNSSPKFGSRSASLLPALFALGCGAPPAARAPAAVGDQPSSIAAAPTPTPAPASAVASASAEPAAVEPVESPGFAQALILLRPAGSEPALQSLISAPGSPEAYAQAALAYAPTEVPGMTLLWGLSYQAMGGGASDVAVAKAFAKVLTERIVAKPDEHRQATFNLRLAPGQMPRRQAADGSAQAPIAHTFEALLGPAVTGFRPPWSIEQFYDALSTWTATVATRGTPLDERVELNAWLVAAAKAGHLEAFCYQLLGSAFPVELKAYKASNAGALEAYRKFIKEAALRPTHAPLPDELVPFE